MVSVKGAHVDDTVWYTESSVADNLMRCSGEGFGGWWGFGVFLLFICGN